MIGKILVVGTALWLVAQADLPHYPVRSPDASPYVTITTAAEPMPDGVPVWVVAKCSVYLGVSVEAVLSCFHENWPAYDPASFVPPKPTPLPMIHNTERTRCEGRRCTSMEFARIVDGLSDIWAHTAENIRKACSRTNEVETILDCITKR